MITCPEISIPKLREKWDEDKAGNGAERGEDSPVTGAGAALSELGEGAAWEAERKQCKGPGVGSYPPQESVSQDWPEGHAAGAEGGRGGLVGSWA